MPRKLRHGWSYTTSTPQPIQQYWVWRMYVPRHWIEDDSTPC